MKKVIISIFILVVTLTNCSAQKVKQEVLSGSFYKLKKDKQFSTSYTLKLNSDSTFMFIIRVQGFQPQCNGKWKIIDDKFILLECNKPTEITEALTANGYMLQKEHKMEIISKDKIKYKDVVLKRKKQK